MQKSQIYPLVSSKDATVDEYHVLCCRRSYKQFVLCIQCVFITYSTQYVVYTYSIMYIHIV